METFTTYGMPYVNLAITIVIGVGMVLVIRHKNSLIETLSAQFKSAQELLQLYDVSKFKDYTKMNEELLEMKHKKELNQAF